MQTVYLDSDTPSNEVLEQLTCNAVDIEGYGLLEDDHGIWVTNPYGVDCALLSPTIDTIDKFMANIRSGVEYGPVPH
jgi:hypothetical protein